VARDQFRLALPAFYFPIPSPTDSGEFDLPYRWFSAVWIGEMAIHHPGFWPVQAVLTV